MAVQPFFTRSDTDPLSLTLLAGDAKRVAPESFRILGEFGKMGTPPVVDGLGVAGRDSEQFG